MNETTKKMLSNILGNMQAEYKVKNAYIETLENKLKEAIEQRIDLCKKIAEIETDLNQ